MDSARLKSAEVIAGFMLLSAEKRTVGATSAHFAVACCDEGAPLDAITAKGLSAMHGIIQIKAREARIESEPGRAGAFTVSLLDRLSPRWR